MLSIFCLNRIPGIIIPAKSKYIQYCQTDQPTNVRCMASEEMEQTVSYMIYDITTWPGVVFDLEAAQGSRRIDE